MHILWFLHFVDNSKDMTKTKNMTNYGKYGQLLIKWIKLMLYSITLQAFASQEGYCQIQRQSFSDNIFQRKGNVLASHFIKCVTILGVMRWVYLDKEAENATSNMMTTYSTVRNQTSKVEGIKYKASMDKLLPNPDFFMIRNPKIQRHAGNCNPNVRTCSLTSNWKYWNWKWVTYKLGLGQG